MMMEMKWKVPAETSCDNSSGQPVIAVPSCVPAPCTFTVEQVREALRAELYKRKTAFQDYVVIEKFTTSLITDVIAALDPPKPKPKTPVIYFEKCRYGDRDNVWEIWQEPRHILRAYAFSPNDADAVIAALAARAAEKGV
jgi:hypothetical protein